MSNWLYGLFSQNQDGYGGAVTLTEFIIMILSLSIAFSVIILYCCKIWKQALLISQNDPENNINDPLIQKNTNNQKISIVHKQLPSCSKIIVMPDGNLNFALDNDYLDQNKQQISRSTKKSLFSGFGFSINSSSLQNQGSLRENESTRELIIYDDSDSNFEMPSFSANNSYLSFLSESENNFSIFKPAENFEFKNVDDFLP